MLLGRVMSLEVMERPHFLFITISLLIHSVQAGKEGKGIPVTGREGQ
jgi:hypothetical protein